MAASTRATSSAERPEASAAAEFALELREVSKRFGAVVANRGVDLQVSPAEIRGLVGENGAGKSTLMAIASGLYSPDAGQIFVNGVEQRFRGREDAIALGINMVHQQFMLVDNCTVAQNVILGQPGTARWLRLGRVETQVRELGERYGIAVDPSAKIEDLTPTERQRVEILTALWRGRKVLILDEPTSVLGPVDIEQLFSTMVTIAAEGCAVIFTSHKLREVIEVCHRISVMRHGELQTTVDQRDADVDMLAGLMVGKALAERADSSSLVQREQGKARRRGAGKATGPVLKIVSARSQDRSGGFGDLAVSPGEIVGVAGVEGNGQRQLAEALTGLVLYEGCEIEFEGRDITTLGPAKRAALGIAFVPEVPIENALIPSFPVMWNLGLRSYRSGGARSAWSVDADRLLTRASAAIQAFDIRGATPLTRTAQLSGGNRQKIVLARELEGDPKLLVVVDPTAGLDVGAAHSVHEVLRDHRDRGAGVILISTDLDEIEALSDRIAVLYRGTFVGIVDAIGGKRRQLGLMMTGLSSSPDAQ